MSVWSEKVKYPLVVTHTFRCCVPGCGVEHNEVHETHFRAEIPRILPQGWLSHFGALICDEHVVHTRVDSGVEWEVRSGDLE